MQRAGHDTRLTRAIRADVDDQRTASAGRLPRVAGVDALDPRARVRDQVVDRSPSHALLGALLQAPGHELAGAADVLDHRLACARRVVGLDRVEDRRVLGDVLLQQAGALADDNPRQVAREADVEVGEGRAQALVACRVLDRQ